MYLLQAANDSLVVLIVSQNGCLKKTYFSQTDRNNIICFKGGDVLTLPLKRKRAKVNLSPDVCNKLVVSEVKLGVNLATLTGQLQVKDNHHYIQVPICN